MSKKFKPILYGEWTIPKIQSLKFDYEVKLYVENVDIIVCPKTCQANVGPSILKALNSNVLPFNAGSGF